MLCSGTVCCRSGLDVSLKGWDDLGRKRGVYGDVLPRSPFKEGLAASAFGNVISLFRDCLCRAISSGRSHPSHGDPYAVSDQGGIKRPHHFSKPETTLKGHFSHRDPQSVDWSCHSCVITDFSLYPVLHPSSPFLRFWSQGHSLIHVWHTKLHLSLLPREPNLLQAER